MVVILMPRTAGLGIGGFTSYGTKKLKNGKYRVGNGTVSLMKELNLWDDLETRHQVLEALAARQSKG